MRTRSRLFCDAGAVFLVAVFGLAGAGEAREKEPYCTWKDGITESRIDESDAWLYANNDLRVQTAFAEHLPFGMPARTGPAVSGERLLAGPHFLIWYDTDLRASLWTAHHLTRYEADVSSRSKQGEKRRDSFRSDPRLDAIDQSRCRDYKELIFDQGHMVPNADLDFVTPGMDYALGMDHSFLMSNMTPQHCAFNRGPWQVLEGLIREWATLASNSWVITGAVFDRDATVGRDPDSAAWRMKGKDGNRRVAIPSHQYKIIAQQWEDGWHVLTVMIENTDHLITSAQRASYLADRVSSLDEVSSRAGFRFFDGTPVLEYEELWEVTSWPALLTSRCQDSYPER